MTPYSKTVFFFLTWFALFSLQREAHAFSGNNTNGFLEEAPSFLTVGEYGDFLNAVAAKDPHHLYQAGSQILRAGTPGHYSYEVVGSSDAPMRLISWFDAARYCNWKENIKTNVQDAGSSESDSKITEHGAYELEGDILIETNAAATVVLVDDEDAFDHELQSSVVQFDFKKNGATQSSSPIFSKETCFYGDVGLVIAGIVVGTYLRGGFCCGNRSEDGLERGSSANLPGSLSPESKERFNEIVRDLPEGSFPIVTTGKIVSDVYENSLDGFKEIGKNGKSNFPNAHDPLESVRASLFSSETIIKPAEWKTVNPPLNYTLPHQFQKMLGAWDNHFTEQNEAYSTGLTPDMINNTFDRIAATVCNFQDFKEWFSRENFPNIAIPQFVKYSKAFEKNPVEKELNVLDKEIDAARHGLLSIDHLIDTRNLPTRLNNEDFQTFFDDYRKQDLEKNSVEFGLGKGGRLMDYEDVGSSVSKIPWILAERMRVYADSLTAHEFQQQSDRGGVSSITPIAEEFSLPSFQKELAEKWKQLAAYRTASIEKNQLENSSAVLSQRQAIAYSQQALEAFEQYQKYLAENNNSPEAQQRNKFQLGLVTSLRKASEQQSLHAKSRATQVPKESSSFFLSSSSSCTSDDGNVEQGRHLKRIADAYQAGVHYAAEALQSTGAKIKEVYSNMVEDQQQVILAIEAGKRKPHPGNFSTLWNDKNDNLIAYQLKRLEFLKAAAEKRSNQEDDADDRMQATAWAKIIEEARIAFDFAIKAWEEKEKNNKSDRQERSSVSSSFASSLSLHEEQAASWSDLQREQGTLVTYYKQAAAAVQAKDTLKQKQLEKTLDLQQSIIDYFSDSRGLAATEKEEAVNLKKAGEASKNLIPAETKLIELNSKIENSNTDALMLARTYQEKLVKDLCDVVQKITTAKNNKTEIGPLLNASSKYKEAVEYLEKPSTVQKPDGISASGEYITALGKVWEYRKKVANAIDAVAEKYKLNRSEQEIRNSESIITFNKERVVAAEKLVNFIGKKLKAVTTESPTVSYWDEVISRQESLINDYDKFINESKSDSLSSDFKSHQAAHAVIVKKSERRLNMLQDRIKLQEKLDQLKNEPSLSYEQRAILFKLEIKKELIEEDLEKGITVADDQNYSSGSSWIGIQVGGSDREDLQDPHSSLISEAKRLDLLQSRLKEKPDSDSLKLAFETQKALIQLQQAQLQKEYSRFASQAEIVPETAPEADADYMLFQSTFGFDPKRLQSESSLHNDAVTTRLKSIVSLLKKIASLDDQRTDEPTDNHAGNMNPVLEDAITAHGKVLKHLVEKTDSSYWEKAAAAQESLLSSIENEQKQASAKTGAQQRCEAFFTDLPTILQNEIEQSNAKVREYEGAGKVNLAARYHKEFNEKTWPSRIEQEKEKAFLFDQTLLIHQRSHERAIASVKAWKKIADSRQKDAALADDPTISYCAKWKLWFRKKFICS